MGDASPERWRRIMEIFDGAIKLPPGERSAYVRTACGEDAELQRAVEELLEASDCAGDFLDRPFHSQARRMLREVAGAPSLSPSTGDHGSRAPTDTSVSKSAPAEAIGPYRLLHKIGEGGMGEVWQAEQSAPIRRRVALKLIKAGMDTKQVIVRFEAERQALALMEHPCIAKVYEAGETPRGLPYFAMEYVAGEPITAYCDRQRLNVRERLRLFMEVCEGVQHAHQKGVIHRDLKPSNVLVSVQEGKPVPKIIDFGVAKATTQRLTERTLFTELGVLVGTPEYMSPEQAEMTGLDVDTRTDVHSLGVILYELLTGTLPFESKELRQAGFEEIRRRIREVEPPRPSARVRTLGERTTDAAHKRKTDPGRLVTSLKGELDWIVMKALEKDRARRYGTPHDLGADVARHLAHEPVMAGPPGAGYRARKFVRRHRLGAGLTAGALVGLVAFGVAMAAQARRIAAERDRAERVTRFLVDLFEGSNPSAVPGNEMTAREVLDRGARRIRTELATEPLVKAELLATIGEVYLNLGLFEEAEPLLNEAVATRTSELGPKHPDTLRARRQIVEVLDFRGEYAEAERQLRDVWQLQRRVLGENHPDTLETLLHLAENSRLQEQYTDMEDAARQVYETRRRDLGEDHFDTIRALRELAVAYEKTGRSVEAEKMYRRVVEGHRRLLGEDRPATLWSVQNLAATLMAQGRFEEAEKLYREAFEGMKRVLGEDHPHTLWVEQDLGTAAYRQGHLDEAERILSEVLEVRRRVLGPDDPRTLATLEKLAAVRAARLAP